MTNEIETNDIEVERIRVNLNQVSKDLFYQTSRLYLGMEISSPTYKHIQENRNKTGLVHKLFSPKKYRYAKGEVERLERLDYLRKSSLLLVDRVNERTEEPVSSQDLKEIIAKIESAENEWKSTPQFKEQRIPDSDLYRLKFQFPDFVQEESREIFETPAEQIKNFNAGHYANEYFECLVKYAKNNPDIVLKVIGKMAEVYKLNKGSGRFARHSITSGSTTTEQDAEYGVKTLGKALGLSNEEIENTFLSEQLMGDYTI